MISNRSNNNSPVYAPVGQNEDRLSEDGSHLHDSSSSEEEEEEPVLSEEVIAQLKQNDPNLTLLKIEFVEYGLLRSSTDWPTIGKLIGSNNNINELHIDGNSGNDGSRKVRVCFVLLYESVSLQPTCTNILQPSLSRLRKS